MIKLDVEEYCHNCPYFEATNCYAGEDGKINYLTDQIIHYLALFVYFV